MRGGDLSTSFLLGQAQYSVRCRVGRGLFLSIDKTFTNEESFAIIK